jgi:hypothetical protein
MKPYGDYAQLLKALCLVRANPAGDSLASERPGGAGLRPLRPAAGRVWVPGYYRWTGNRYVWVEGYWR